MSQPAIQETNTWAASRADGVTARQQEVLNLLKGDKVEKIGEHLKQLRELAQKSEEELAAEINLSVDQLQALESDDKSKLPAPIYVKGYLKRYAAALDLPDKEVLQAYETLSKEASPTLSRVSISKKMESRQSSMRLGTYTAVIALVILVLLWAKTVDFDAMWKNAVTPGPAVTIEKKTELSLPAFTEDETQGSVKP